MGGRTQAALRVLLKATRFLHRDGYAVLASRLRGLQWDLGRGWEARLDLGERDVSAPGGFVSAGLLHAVQGLARALRAACQPAPSAPHRSTAWG